MRMALHARWCTDIQLLCPTMHFLHKSMLHHTPVNKLSIQAVAAVFPFNYSHHSLSLSLQRSTAGSICCSLVFAVLLYLCNILGAFSITLLFPHLINSGDGWLYHIWHGEPQGNSFSKSWSNLPQLGLLLFYHRHLDRTVWLLLRLTYDIRVASSFNISLPFPSVLCHLHSDSVWCSFSAALPGSSISFSFIICSSPFCILHSIFSGQTILSQDHRFLLCPLAFNLAPTLVLYTIFSWSLAHLHRGSKHTSLLCVRETKILEGDSKCLLSIGLFICNHQKQEHIIMFIYKLSSML